METDRQDRRPGGPRAIAVAMVACFAAWLPTALGADPVPRADPRAPRGERWAMLIGVKDYTVMGDLKYPQRDAEELAKQLIAAGFPERNVQQLTDGKAPAWLPMKSNIERQLKLLLNTANGAELVVVAFFGHGIERGKVAYLCPADACPDDKDGPEKTMISLDSVYRQLEGCRAQRKVLLVDACRDDPHPPGTRGPADGERDNREFLASLPKTPKGIVALLGASSGERAWEDQGLQHGVFPHFLIEGISGKADWEVRGNGDGRVTFLELFEYASAKTRRYVADTRRVTQTPVVRGEFEGDFEVAAAPTARVSAVFRFLQDKNGLPAQGVAAQLWRRLPGQPGGVLVEKGVSDAEGYVRIEVRLGRAPQTPEEYRLAAVKGDIQKSWALPEFPAKRIWELHLLDEPPLAEMLERQRRLAEEMTLSEMQTVIKEARRKMAADPDAAAADLKLALESVRRAPDLSPKTRAALVEDLQKALRGAGAEARRTNLDSKFAPAGKATEGWTTVAGSGGQEIERGDFTAVGDFALHFTVSASRGPHHRKYPRAAIVLVGADGGDDLKIEMAKLNSWSGVDTWEFQTPAGKSSKGLAPGSRTLTLRREGELFTFTADAVFNQNSQDRTIAKFPAGNCGRFAGMRLAVSGPDITPERLRIEPVLRVR